MALLATGFIRDPQVAVVVQQYRSKIVFVVGEVARPGPYPLVGTRRTFLVFALAIALVAVLGLRPVRRYALAPAAIAVLIALPDGPEFVGALFGTIKLGRFDTPFKEYGDDISFLGVSSGNFTSTSALYRRFGFGTSNTARFHERAQNAV